MRLNQILLILLLGGFTSYGQSVFKDVTEVEISQPFLATSPLAKYRYDSLSYEHARAQQEYVYERFTYDSDGFDVIGWSCRPRIAEGKKIPVIIYNRGGTGNIGRLSEEDLPDFYWLASKGFVVYASDYRFVDEMGSVDQSGGDDINDVINLYKAVKRINYVDSTNIFMMGVSRGGMMTYKSLTRIDVNAAAVIGGVADLDLQARERPIFVSGWSDLEDEYNYQGLENILPDFENKRAYYMAQRSAVDWADEINSPVYILHSRQDGRVPVEGAITLARQLSRYDKEYKLKIYDEKSHGLPYSRFDSFEEIIGWFKSHISGLSE